LKWKKRFNFQLTLSGFLIRMKTSLRCIFLFFMAQNYNIKEREEYWRQFWQDNEIYKFDEKSQKPFYSLDTPPPYVSADHLHVGHIMSYSQAEFIVRFKRMNGFEIFYPMGFDDNGLPTERFVEKKYKIDKAKISRSEFIKTCLAETKTGAETYKKLWTLLGISVDWSKTYSTINEHCRKISQWSFLDLYSKGRIYKAKKPTLWCTTCQTAIAQADLEAEEKESQLVYIKAKAETGEELVFATTRPELLPACMGISVHPDDARYKNLIGKKIIMPLTGAEIILTTDEATDINFGSGVVYYCSYGGGECIEWLSRHPKAKTVNLILAGGKISDEGGKYAGQKILAARQNIIADLEKAGALEKIEPIKHTVHVHERCQTDVEYIETEQWFIKLLDKKEELLKRGKELRWYPGWMAQNYENWVSGLKWDWCISRQRYYGVPFPIWYCQKCGEIILAAEKDLPVDPSENSPGVKTCPKCGGSEFAAETDVMDTWMTSSLTPVIASRLVADENLQKKLYPMSLRPQAFEIIRTWLFYTVAKSHLHDNHLPFIEAMISGHGLDEQGRKISKRLGNYVIPDKIVDQYGADALRYWATGANLGENLRYNENEVKKGKRTVTKLYNAGQFCFSHFLSKNYSKLEVKNLPAEDKWVLNHLNQTIAKATKFYNEYQYAKAKNEIDEFFWNIFADNYLEFIKHRLYQDTPDETAKAVLYQVFLAILKMYAPTLPFITEEVYQQYFKEFEKDKSIHVSEWPKEIEFELAEIEIAEFNLAVTVIAEIRKYKSENQISLGKTIENFETEISVSEKYFDFIKSAVRVENLAVKK